MPCPKSPSVNVRKRPRCQWRRPIQHRFGYNFCARLLSWGNCFPAIHPFRRMTETYMWEDANYCWVVLCKNHWFHIRQNIFFRHRIPLGQTHAVTPLPLSANTSRSGAMRTERGIPINPREQSELKAHDSLPTRRASFSALTCDLRHAVLRH